MTVQQPGSDNGSNQGSSNTGSSAGVGGQAPNIQRADLFMQRAFKYRSNGAEIQHYADALNKQMSDDLKKDYRFIAVDDPSSLAISALVFTRRAVASGAEHIFFFTLPIEATSRVPNSRQDTLNNQTVDTFQGASDALDTKMFESIKQRLAAVFPSKQTQFHNCGAMTVYSDIDPKNEESIHQILVAAGRAVDGHAATFFNAEPPFAISWIPKDTRILSKISYAPPQVNDASGMPLRTDVSVEVVARVNQSTQQSIHNDERTITSLGGYIDQIYAQPPPPQVHGQVVPPQRYYPRLVVTSIRSALDAETLETRLFSLLAGGLLLSRSMNWAGVYLPRHGIDPKKDTRDIGAIGYEVPLDIQNPNVPLGAKVKTRDPKFTREDLGSLIRTGFHQNLIISFDAIELGPDSWLDETFLLSARNRTEATAAILQAADNLTNGHFKALYKGGPVLVDDNNRIHIGWYTDEQGVKRDIRELDYLALLNLTGDKGLQAVIDWDKSFDDTTVDPRIRLDARRQILRARFEDRLVLKGYARRLTFTAAFLMTLADASVAAGLDIRPENSTLDLANHGARGYYDVSAYGINPQMSAGLFNMGQTGYVGQMGAPGYAGYTTRW